MHAYAIYLFLFFAATTTLKLSCSGGEVEGRYIHIEDNRNRIDYFSLCEIQIFVNKGIVLYVVLIVRNHLMEIKF